MFKNFTAAYGTLCLLFLGVYLLAGRMRGGQVLGVVVAVFLAFGYACIATGLERSQVEQLRKRVRELEQSAAGGPDGDPVVEERPDYR